MTLPEITTPGWSDELIAALDGLATDATKPVFVEPKEDWRPRLEPAVYFIEVRGFIKIGWSVKWRSRISNIQTSNPEPIKVLLVLGRPQIFERTMHRKFAEHRASGEWFRDHPDIRAYIQSREDECWYRAGRFK